jgi:eukaryotic-like serine/threonine-protein kinase
MQAQTAPPTSPQAGDVVAGKYHLVRSIGLGAMGLVFEATHLRMQQRVAIKFMQAKLVGQTEAVARFEREGRAASRLTSPHATRIFDVDSTPDGVPYIVSELLDGQDLRHELDEREKLPIEEAVSYVIQACAVMAEAHSFGIVHRDLKPSNLFLAKTSVGRVVKVLDFGISKMDEELELTTTGFQVGSPRYMSPEQVEAKRVDRRADIWALGVILYRALSGAYPFEGNTSISLALAILTRPPRDLVSLRPEVPPGLVDAIKKALARDVLARHATARDFAEALAPFASPEAAALARSLTSEVPVVEPSKPALRLMTPGTDTLKSGKMDIDALIDVSFEPPEQATRGTWTQPSAAKPERKDRKGGLLLRVAGALGAVAVLSAFAFGFARYGASRAQASASVADVPTAQAAAAPAPVAPPQSTPRASPSASVSAEVVTPPPSPSTRTTRPPVGGVRPPPRNGPGTPASPQTAPPPKNPTYL